MTERTEVGRRNWAIALGGLLALGACGGSGSEPSAADSSPVAIRTTARPTRERASSLASPLLRALSRA